MFTRGIRRAAVATIVAAFALQTTVSAQYFGRNKVQYKQLDFQILKTDHFDIYFYPSAREGIDIAARLAERWHARLERLLGRRLQGRQPLVLRSSECADLTHPDLPGLACLVYRTAHNSA